MIKKSKEFERLMHPAKDNLTNRDVCELLGCKSKYINQVLVKKKDFPARKVHGTGNIVVSRKALQDWVIYNPVGIEWREFREAKGLYLSQKLFDNIDYGSSGVSV